MPKVSIIIPTYNRSNFVIEAIESVLNQGLADLEIIIINDGSQDDTISVVRAINDKRIRYFSNSHRGLSSARNLGLAKAQGQYIAFLDDDDLFGQHYLETMLDKLDKKTEYGLAYSRYTKICHNGQEVEGFGNDCYMSGWLTENFFRKRPRIVPSAICCRRTALKAFYFDEYLHYMEDLDFLLRLSLGTQFVCVPEVSIMRRIHRDNISTAAAKNLSANIPLILERFYFHMGGREIVPHRIAKWKISREYRSLAKGHYRLGNRKAAISFFEKAISYYPYDPQYYRGLLKALLMSKKKDPLPDWQQPEPLPTAITVTQKY